MKKIVLISAIVSANLLTGCATIVSGNHQKIAIATSPFQDAQCALKNDKGSWQVDKTPGNVIVHKSQKDLIIICTKKGYSQGVSTVKPALNKIVFGNIVFGGIIGGFVDLSNGSAYKYPTTVTVPLALKK